MKKPNFNLPTEIKALYCKNHKKENMIDVINKRCCENNCMTRPNYNLPTETKALYCFEHKKENMIDVTNKRCCQDNCIKQPVFNLPTETKGLYCFEHKKENMIDIVSKRCFEDNCMKIPAFNLPTETKGLYCSEHKKENMIDIVSKRCCQDNCMKRPTFNLPTETKGLYCSEHKKENMIDVINKRCCQENCMKIPAFNLPTEFKALYCFDHKKEDMINVKSKRCYQENCIKIPNFNLPTEFKALYCFEHKTNDMINITNKNCQHQKCKELAIFGFINKRSQFCLEHKQENMINLVLENKCSVLDCDNEYCHLVDTDKYCNTHIPTENYDMVVKRLCKYCDIKEESKFICKDCKKIQNKKEWAIVRHLRKVIDTSFEYNSSKMLQGCSKKRPDIYFELPTHCVIVEIDENQHNTYEDTCECARINEIVNGIGGKPVIIIRYNPDIIKNNGKQQNMSQNDKIDLLVNTIKKELVYVYEIFMVKIIQIFYNDNYEVYQAIKEEIITDKVCI